MEAISESLCYNLYGDEDCQWVSVLWWEIAEVFYLFDVSSKLSLFFLLWVKGWSVRKFGGYREEVFYINMYSKCDLVAKRRLSEKLVFLRNYLGVGAWYFISDFNAANSREERRGVNGVTSVELR